MVEKLGENGLRVQILSKITLFQISVIAYEYRYICTHTYII